MLQNGISGFFDYGDCVVNVTLEKYKSIIVPMLSSHGYRLIETQKAGVTPNFHTLTFQKKDIVFNILCNATHKVIAFTNNPIKEYQSIQFIDYQEVQKLFETYGDITVVMADELNRPITDNDSKNLNEAEWKQIAYWKPQSIGEIIFNWWD